MNAVTRVTGFIVLGLSVLPACPKPGPQPAAPLPPEPVANRVSEPSGELQVPRVDEVRAPEAHDLGDLAGAEPQATITTNLGTLHCTLEPAIAPLAVANFIGLATGAKAWLDPSTHTIRRGTPFYQGLIFHRVIPDFMIQGGDPLGTGTGGPGYAFGNEIAPGADFSQPGVLAMANAGPDTNGSQFFITDKATPWLDGHHTIFGHCAELDVIDAIANVPRDPRDRPLDRVVIRSITFSR